MNLVLLLIVLDPCYSLRTPIVSFTNALYSSSWFDTGIWETDPPTSGALPEIDSEIRMSTNDVTLKISSGEVALANKLTVGLNAYRNTLVVEENATLDVGGDESFLIVSDECCDSKLVVEGDGSRVDVTGRLLIGVGTKGTYEQLAGVTLVGSKLTLGSGSNGSGFLHIKGGSVRVVGGEIDIGEQSKVEMEGGNLEIFGDVRSEIEKYKNSGKIMGDFDVSFSINNGWTVLSPTGGDGKVTAISSQSLIEPSLFPSSEPTPYTSLFYIEKQNLSWQDHYDRAISMGYFIASVQNELEDLAIMKLVRELPKSNRRVWLGGRRIAPRSDTWIWADGIPFNYVNFEKNEPNNIGGNEDCIDTYHHDTSTPWNDKTCSDRLYAVYRKFPLDVSPEPSSVPSSPPCDSSVDYCDFTTTFDIDFGDLNYLLDDRYAQSAFSLVTTSWINDLYECEEVEELYYSFNIINDDNKRFRRQGKASGKCRGKNCPKKVQFSAPNRHRNLCGVDLLEELQEEPVFNELEEIRMEVFNDTVEYETTVDECVELQCSSAQRNATRTALLSLRSTYDESVHECLWNGIQCDEKKVVSMQLADKKLSGSIPETIGQLDDLENIFLSGNSISGSIPTEIGMLKNLHQIELDNNEISSTIPTELGKLEKLNVVRLDDNRLIGTVPTELALLVNNLQLLYLSGNDLSGDKSHVCFPQEVDFFCAGRPTPFPTITPTDDDDDESEDDDDDNIILAIIDQFFLFLDTILDFFSSILDLI